MWSRVRAGRESGPFFRQQPWIAAIDSKTLKVLDTWSIAPCKEPRGLAIDVAHKRLFAGCLSGSMVMVDYTSGRVVDTVPIGQGTDATRFDPVTGLAFASWRTRTHRTNRPWFKRSRRRPGRARWRSTRKTTTSIPSGSDFSARRRFTFPGCALPHHRRCRQSTRIRAAERSAPCAGTGPSSSSRGP
jgi:hypothetical protein